MPIFEFPKRTCLWTLPFSILMSSLMPVTAQSQHDHLQSPSVVTLRTLAQIQQWQDEMNLRDRIDTLQDKLRTRGIERSQSATSVHTSTGGAAVIARTDAQLDNRTSQPNATKAGIAANSAESGRRQPPSTRRRPALKLLSVYGPAHRLSAETLDAGGNLHAIEERDTVGAWVVRHIRQEGILLHRDGKGDPEKRGIFLAVGESLHEPPGESGTGSATESMTAGARP